MSLDIFLQAFRRGDAASGDGEAAIAVLTPLFAERSDHGWALIQTGDGTAEVHGINHPDQGLMFNHVGGRIAWDVIFAVARDAGFVIMPVGCGTLLTHETMWDELPEGIPEPILTIESGADLLAVIESDE